MIAFLSGVVREVREHSAIILTGGVGYEVLCPVSTLGKLTAGAPAELHTRLVVREDAWTLFGFADTDSLKLFELLTTVTGVGPKLGLALLSAMPPRRWPRACSAATANCSPACRAWARKRPSGWCWNCKTRCRNTSARPWRGGARLRVISTAGQDAVDALLALGFRDAQVRAAVSELLAQDPEQSADQLIRKSLGRLR